ncbi:MAG: sugar kinase [Fimbriimonas sp.]|nr:sugar kinase [Fimbriimonas sp.]
MTGTPKWDLVALGEVMLRLDPGEGRIHTTRTFTAWEGGGEYNVARGLRRTFGKRTAIVTALADNPVGRLVEDLMLQGGVALDYLKWFDYDGVGRAVRNGLNFTERGFGVRAALGCSDRGHTAVSQLIPLDFSWTKMFCDDGAHWFHTGGIFAALSETTPEVALQAMKEARKNGTRVSYDLNYRPSLWKGTGGSDKAKEVNRALAPYVDLLLGNEEDFTSALGFEVDGADLSNGRLDEASYVRMIEQVVSVFPNISMVATTMRVASTASKNDWGAILWTPSGVFHATPRPGLEILDRVGGGDSFASGLIYGLLEGKDPQWCVDCGAAHGALAMTTPGDTSMATLGEVLKAMKGGTARVDR